jgi:DASS family divalent anion:Na+ symporter
VPVLIPVILLLLPVPAGLAKPAWQLFAIYIGAILGLMLRPFPEAVVLLVAIGVSGICFKNTSAVLSGYASASAWLVFVAFMIGQAFVETGLGSRIAYILIGKFGRSTLGLGYVATFTDLIISPATPSNTARTGGLVYPIFRSLAVTLGSEPGPTARKLGAYMSLLLYQVSITTATMFVTSSAVNVIGITFAKSIFNVEITWMQWATALFPPAFLILLALPYIVYKLYPPEIKHINNKEISEQGLKQIGPTTKREKILVALFILAIIGWATGGITKIDATAVAIGFISACLVTGVISWDGLLNAKSAWSTLIWYGGIISMADGLAKTGFFTWLSQLLGQNISFVGYDVYVIYAGLLLLGLSVRYFFASLAPYYATFIPVLFTLGVVAQVPPLALVFLLAAEAEFGCLLTHYGNAVAPVLFGPGYVDQATWWKIGTIITLFCAVVYMTVGMVYWKALGLW